MDFSAVTLTEAQQQFRDEVRAFLDEHLTEEVYAGVAGEAGRCRNVGEPRAPPAVGATPGANANAISGLAGTRMSALRDGNRCQYTGKLLRPDEGSLDHVLPRSRGGRDTWENLVWSGKDVNARKGNRLPHEGKGRARRFHPEAVNEFRTLRQESVRGGRRGRGAGGRAVRGKGHPDDAGSCLDHGTASQGSASR